MNPEEIKQELDLLKAEKFHLLKLINHDIRSPFNRIFALMQLLEMDSPQLSAQQQEYFDAINLTVLSGLEMVQNLRDMRDIDGGFVRIEMNDTNLDEILKKAIRNYSRQLELKHITIAMEPDSGSVKLIADGFYLQRCIENLLSNAIKFSQTHKEINLSSRMDGDSIIIEVKDKGPGIKMDEEHFLFEKFKKLSSLATGGEGSLGLGLYNTHRFMKMMNGSVRLVRNGNLGSCFELELPSK